MKLKIMAQRKFAQGVNLPPSNSSTNPVVEKRTADVIKDRRNVFHNNTSASTLLDIISFDGLHNHKPVVILERLKDVNVDAESDAVNDEVAEINSNLLKETTGTRNLPSKPRTPNVTGRIALLKNSRSMFLRSGAKINNNTGKKIAKKKRITKKRIPTKKRRNPSRKAAYLASMSWRLTPTDTEFSVDDDRPLTYFTRTANLKVSNQTQEGHSAKNKTKSGAMSKEADAQQMSVDEDEPTHELDRSGPPVNSDRRTGNHEEDVDEEDCSEMSPAEKEDRSGAVVVSSAKEARGQQVQAEKHGRGKVNQRAASGIRGPRSRAVNEASLRGNLNQPGPSGISGTRPRAGNEESLRGNLNQPGPSGISGTRPRAGNEESLRGDLNQPGPSGISGTRPRAGNEESLRGDLNQPGPSGISGTRPRAGNEESLRGDLNQPGPSGISGTRPRADNEESLRVEDNTSDSQLFDEIQRWMEMSAPSVPAPETFKVPALPARLRKKQKQTANRRSEGAAGKSIPTNSPQSQSPQSSAQKRKEKTSNRQNRQSTRSISPTSTIASLDDIVTVTNTRNVVNSRQQPETSSDDDIDIPISQRRNNSGQESFRKKKKADKAKLVDAPVFRPTPAEFEDPVAYFEKIMPLASKYGLCKVVAPPGFSPTCNINDAIRFVVFNQYIARVFCRWGSATRELCTIRAYLASQKVVFAQAPLLGGMEVNLAKLYYAVQRNGGIKAVTKKKWTKVADEVCCGKITNPDKKLDQLYVKYLVPYDTLTKRERHDMINKMELLWIKRNKEMLERAANPLHRQKRLLGESDSSDEEDDERRYPHMIKALKEAEECIIRGRQMHLHNFKRIAHHTFKKHFPRGAGTTEIEDFYWSFVLLGSEHVCVNTASIDTGSEGYGFTKNEDEPYGSHPWNLKMLSKNNGNVLRLLGPVLGLTVPTLNLGMVFSTSCWHRDPHGLPWMEYMHQGTSKIWYGIPEQESERFRKAVEILCPTSCQNKSLWLPSDITMIPPNLLLEHNVSLSRVVQDPGEFIIVFPKSYSCSICTGYTISESVYFATNSWVNSINQVFQELRESCEPSMFSLEQLLISAARDPRASLTMLQLVHANLAQIINEERENRAIVESYGIEARMQTREDTSGSWTVRDEDECEICRTALYLSRVKGVFRKNGSLCLPHVIQVLEDKGRKITRRGVSNYEFEIFFTVEELDEIISTSKRRLLNVRQVT